jgi:hypothetical protein
VRHLILKDIELYFINMLINSSYFDLVCLLRGFDIVVLAEIVK